MCPRAGYHWFECCTDDQKEISFNGRKPCMRPTAHDPGKAADTLPVPWEGTGIAPYAGQAIMNASMTHVPGGRFVFVARHHTIIIWEAADGCQRGTRTALRQQPTYRRVDPNEESSAGLW